jgi:hypothetical protein
MKAKGTLAHPVSVCAASCALMALHCGSAASAASPSKATFSAAAAFDVSRPAREIAPPIVRRRQAAGSEPLDIRPERGPTVKDNGFMGDAALAPGAARFAAQDALMLAIAPPLDTFEGLSNQDNFDLFGFRSTRRTPSVMSVHTTTSK